MCKVGFSERAFVNSYFFRSVAAQRPEITLTERYHLL
jgi:hypothetical protein